MKRVYLLGTPAIVAAVLAACTLPQATPTGRQDFAAYCAACHGDGGRGDGPSAANLARKPADLTGISRRNGGTFPGTRVMAKIWGYTGGQDGAAVMPAFGPLLDGDLVPYDGGDGIATPERLVGIAEYLRSIQTQ